MHDSPEATITSVRSDERLPTTNTLQDALVTLRLIRAQLLRDAQGIEVLQGVQETGPAREVIYELLKLAELIHIKAPLT
jgi:hypothetical protein